MIFRVGLGWVGLRWSIKPMASVVISCLWEAFKPEKGRGRGVCGIPGA